MDSRKAKEIDALRVQIARRQTTDAANRRLTTLKVGLPAIDDLLPGHGLQSALHEVAGGDAETEHGAAAALFLAGILARQKGTILWVQERSDLFAPALAGVGLPPERVIFLQAGRHVLAAMEEGLRSTGLAGVVAETTARITLTASRRLHLAAEAAGTFGFLLRRCRSVDDPRLAETTAAVTRWRITSLPSPPPLLQAPDVPGLARAVWRVNLIRCRGGEPATWIVEASDAQGHLRLVSDVSDRSIAEDRRRVAGWGTVRHGYA
jgi:protein ImuA